MWNKLSSKVIFSHPRITLVEDKVELPNGQQKEYLKFEKVNNVAAIICVGTDGKILMQKEYAYPLDKKIFQFPGGSINNDLNLAEEANRELMEESKLKANHLELIGKFLINNRRTDAMVYVFLGSDLVSSSLEPDPEEEIENFWFYPEEITDMIKNGEIIENDALACWAIYLSQK